ncbi:MAG: ester cyclase [Aphanothece sp. CMT-3BRIN-NPC111]|nr:ester cyclase [Aphanothece sp. CMT-3BRIN-NPC111]
MSAEDYKTLISHKFYQESVDEGHLDLVDELFSPECAFYAAGSYEPVGRDTFKEYLGIFRKALGISHTIDEQIAEGDKVVTRWTVNGTHQGEFQGVAPTGKAIRYSGVSIFRFADGKIAEVWSSFDELGLLEQIGAIARLLDRESIEIKG